MNHKTKILEELNKYVQNAKKFELPVLRQQCVQMIKMIDHRMFGKPMPVMKIHWWKKLFMRNRK